MPGTQPPVLKHEIGLFCPTALGIGAIIGSGIFIVTGTIASVAGPAMIVFVFIAVFSAMSMAELGAYLPEESGTYHMHKNLFPHLPDSSQASGNSLLIMLS
jgi:amino acid transporter